MEGEKEKEKKNQIIGKMEKAREALSVDEEHKQVIGDLPVQINRSPKEASFFEGFFLRGIRVDRAEPGSLSCTFKVPPRLTDSSGNLSAGAIASLVDEVGFAVIYADGHLWKVSTDISISYMATAKLDDELEISSRVLGHKGGYSGTQVVLKNKRTGEIVAEGRHSLFGFHRSNI